ncbi:MAG: hypothetical protein ISS13_04415 [Actinobacteria bacterium]|nr:hypothetical protein [Actinomycetota bacterium]MBL7061058.1 hypothetical protein [Actinomycetota bacterium]
MKILKIPKDEIKEYERLKIISQIAMVKGKIELFGKKYKCSFDNFAKEVKKRENEDFDIWDDYIEWKAYIKALDELKHKIKEIDNVEDITVT